VAAESPHGQKLALQWIESKEDNIAAAGWATLSSLLTYLPNEQIDLALYTSLLERVEKNIRQAMNRESYAMNGFIIALGSQIPSLSETCIETAERLGPVTVDMDGTACKVPNAGEYIYKIQEKGAIGKKKKTVRC
jgi:hypothetical protein